MLIKKFVVILQFATWMGIAVSSTSNSYCRELLQRCDIKFPNWGKQKLICINQCMNFVHRHTATGNDIHTVIVKEPSKLYYLDNYGHKRRYRRPHKTLAITNWNRKRYNSNIPKMKDLEDKKHQLYTSDGDKIWEGDMILTTDQVHKLYKRGRKAKEPLEYRWPKGNIPFVISESSQMDRRYIIDAINHWRENTCITFQELSRSDNMNQPHVIFKQDAGCYSQVGKDKKKNGQPLSVGPGCADMGTIAHEIGHAVGFYHEHCRRDRDQFIRIETNNVKDKFKGNFKFKQDITTLGVPYDIQSLMHYAAKEFSSNGRNTILTLDPMKQFDIGQRNELSFYDKKLANLMYNCSAHCKDQAACFNDGFMDKTCTCRCPSEFTGEYCQQSIPASDPKCGGYIFQNSYITSPNFPQNYPSETRCVWWIKAPEGKRVALNFATFDVLPRNMQPEGCKVDYLEMRGANKYDGDFFCGNELHEKEVVSKGRDLIVLLATKYNKNRGFKAMIQLVNAKDSSKPKIQFRMNKKIHHLDTSPRRNYYYEYNNRNYNDYNNNRNDYDYNNRKYYDYNNRKYYDYNNKDRNYLVNDYYYY